MTKKFLAVAIATLMLTGACQSDYVDMPTDSPTAETKGMSRSTGFTFPDGWQYLESNDERWEALQIPENFLSTMSTEELVEACMSYPLATDCFFYNNVEQGLLNVISRFNGFAELKQREDAIDKVLDFYDFKLDEIETLGGSIGYTINPLRLSFYERFIISGYLCPKDTLKNSEKFNKIFNKTELIHNSFEELQGDIASESLKIMKDLLGLSKLSRYYYGRTQKTITTKGGRSVIAWIPYCVDAKYDADKAKEEIQNNYPDAIIIGDGTCTYNCHAYAWWVSEGGDKCWINKTESGVDNLSNFYNDGTYVATTTPVAGDKVLYLSDDHSAIVYSGDTFTSKWGSLALVRHKYNYGPYDYSSLKYYKKGSGTSVGGGEEEKDPPFKTGKVYWDMFPDPTPLNSYEDFSISDYYDSSRFRVDIFVSNPKEQDEPIEDSSRAYVTSRTDQTATVYFASPGIYYVCFHVYSKTTGNCVAKYISEEVYVQA